MNCLKVKGKEVVTVRDGGVEFYELWFFWIMG